MTAAAWISPTVAIELIRAHFDTTVDQAQKLLRDALGEVRVLLELAADDGIVGMGPGGLPGGSLINRADLEGWLKRNPQDTTAPPEENTLAAQGARVLGAMFSNTLIPKMQREELSRLIDKHLRDQGRPQLNLKRDVIRRACAIHNKSVRKG